jgi:hypothetical protein
MRKRVTHKEPGLEVTEIFDVDPSWYGFAPPAAGASDVPAIDLDDPDGIAGSGE